MCSEPGTRGHARPTHPPPPPPPPVSTHLPLHLHSCAFRNTPKFSAVRGHGKIVRGEWLSACAKQKRRLPWRRFSTDPADGKQPDSGDELWAEELRPTPPAVSGEWTAGTNCGLRS